jgi:hypothetical protein
LRRSQNLEKIKLHIITVLLFSGFALCALVETEVTVQQIIKIVQHRIINVAKRAFLVIFEFLSY